MKIALFAYNFEHKKTQDFIFALFAKGYKIDLILAADPVKLNLKSNVVRTKVRYGGLIHPNEIAQAFNIPYFVVKHNSEECISLLRRFDIDLGIISGARILKSNVINSCKIGILNFHPAVLPHCRGLDSLLWSIENGIPLGVTSHLIEGAVDSGRIVSTQTIGVMKDDTLFDLTEKLNGLQVSMLSDVLKKIQEEDISNFEVIDLNYPNYGKMTDEQEIATLHKLKFYLGVYGN